MCVALAEKTGLKLQIGSIKRLVSVSFFLNKPINLDPNTWDHYYYPFLPQKNKKDVNLVYVNTLKQIKPGQWAYDKQHNQLVYRIKEPRFFKADNNLPYILLSLDNNQKEHPLKLSKFQWCKKITFRGCLQWD